MAAFTTAPVLAGHPVLFVYHSAEDGAWQFLCGTTDRDEEGRLIGLQEALRIEPALREVADLPEGWRAYRESAGAPWVREPYEEVE